MSPPKASLGLGIGWCLVKHGWVNCISVTLPRITQGKADTSVSMVIEEGTQLSKSGAARDLGEPVVEMRLAVV